MSRAAYLLLAAALAGCQAERHVVHRDPVEPPVAGPDAIPVALVQGTIRGAKFVLRDARYVVDRRVGYEHVDIKLSSGASESACAEIKPRDATSVWLRLDRSDKIVTQDLRLSPGKEGPWSVHYQIRDGGGWSGSGDGSAVVSLRLSSGDGKLSGGIAVCFADGAKSCVSGSFEADPCPSSIDAPVRGTPPPEAIPERYRKLMDAGAPEGGAADPGRGP